jgi:hypothetical protein
VFKNISDAAQNVVNSINTLLFQNPILLTEDIDLDMDLVEELVGGSDKAPVYSRVSILSKAVPVHKAHHTSKHHHKSKAHTAPKSADLSGGIDSYLQHVSPGNTAAALARFHKMRKADKVLKKLQKQETADTEVGNVEAEIAKYLQRHSTEEETKTKDYAKSLATFRTKHLQAERNEHFTLINSNKIVKTLHHLQRKLAKRWSKLMQRVTKFDAYQAKLCGLVKQIPFVTQAPADPLTDLTSFSATRKLCVNATHIACVVLPEGTKRFGIQFNKVMKVAIDYLKDLKNKTNSVAALDLNDASRHDGRQFQNLGCVLACSHDPCYHARLLSCSPLSCSSLIGFFRCSISYNFQCAIFKRTVSTFDLLTSFRPFGFVQFFSLLAAFVCSMFLYPV